MANYKTNEFKNSLKILINGDPMVIINNEFVKPGKGQAFNRLKLKNLLNNKIIEKTFKAGEYAEIANINEVIAIYLYFDNINYIFMHPETFDQYSLSKENIGDVKKWLKIQNKYQIVFFNNKPIAIKPPNFVNLTVTKINPGLKRDNISTGYKIATLSTGAIIKVPIFVQIGEIIKVDTRTSSYISRIKN